jgi:GNAT superfamily N-acetyltransferase
MYVADLVSMPAERSKGYGNQIFEYLEDTAKKAGCTRYGS